MKTPEEIKKGLECCYGDKEKRLCDSCPNSAKIEGYTELICLDFDSIGEDASPTSSSLSAKGMRR